MSEFKNLPRFRLKKSCFNNKKFKIRCLLHPTSYIPNYFTFPTFMLKLHNISPNQNLIFSGMFSFFAVPILLGDITIDFMKMVDVMVDVMVMVTGTGSGNGNNNNNNNNNNGGEGGGEGEGGGNNNNNNNNNRRRRSDTGSSMAKCYKVKHY